MTEPIILPINKAKEIAENWAERIKSLPGVQACEVAGDVRRWCETAEVIDLAVSTTDGDRLMGFANFQPEVSEILGREDHTLNLRLAEGARLRLRAQSPEYFGSLLLNATGSEGHLARLRQIASERGLAFSAENLLTEAGKPLECRWEDEVYGKLGLPAIAPEMREDRGEIEAAARGNLPRLITQSDLHADLHMHSDWSDGHNSIREMAENAIAIGHQVIAIADHSPFICQPIHGKSIDAGNLQEQKAAIRQVQKEVGDKLRILHGIEVDIRPDGQLDLDDDTLAQFDLVVASLHSALDQSREMITKRLIGALCNPYVKIIAHPTGRDFPRPGTDANWEEFFRAAAETGKAVEINSNPHHLDLNDRLARQAAAMGVRLTIDTDAHSAAALINQKYGVGIARRAWLTKENVISCLELDDLLKFLRD